MSWITTTSIASLAKNALKEAQKTIDKALDITENKDTKVPCSASGETTNIFEPVHIIKEDQAKPTPVEECHVGSIRGPEPDVSSAPTSSLATSIWNSFSASITDSNFKALLQDKANKPMSDEVHDSPKPNYASNDDQSSGVENLQAALKISPLLVEVEKSCLLTGNETNEKVGGQNFGLHSADNNLKHEHPSSSVDIKDEKEVQSLHESFSIPVAVSSSDVADLLSRDNTEEISCDGKQTNTSFEASSSGFSKSRNAQDEKEVHELILEALKDSIDHSASMSGDDQETTASSDIEILSSPQTGERKITTATCIKEVTLGVHHREPSEASEASAASDESLTCGMEAEKLGHKFTDLMDILEVRENQATELSIRNVTLVNEIDQLKSQLTQHEKNRLVVEENIRRQTEDFAQRLGSLEKRYQQVLAERNALLAQSETAKPLPEVTRRLEEQEIVIAELRIEGEKLSRQQLQHSNIIKKLRAKEKEDERQLRVLKESCDELNREVGSLKKALTAKEELETNQTETIRLLTVANTELEKELEANKYVIRDLHSECASLRTELADVRKALTDLESEAMARETAEMERNLGVEIALRRALQTEYDSSIKQFEEEKQALTLRCNDLIHTLALVDSDRSKDKEQTRNELSRLMTRIEEAEARNDELSQALTTATRPLLRQIDTLQLALSSQRLAEERSESTMEKKLCALQRELQATQAKEAASNNLNLVIQARLDEVLEKLTSSTEEKSQLSIQLAEEKQRLSIFEKEAEKNALSLEMARRKLEEEMQTLKEELYILKQSYEFQSVTFEEEKRKSDIIIERLQEKDVSDKPFLSKDCSHTVGTNKSIGNPSHSQVASVSRSSSPTPSLGKLSLTGSLTESHSSNHWISTDEVFSRVNVTPTPRGTLYDTMRSGSLTTVFEHLQLQLKTRDDEVLQLQNELQEREKTRDGLAKELASFINSNQELHRRLEQAEVIQSELRDLHKKYNALLQMYGEKLEENQELRLDLADVKEMYKAQIDQLMKT